MMPLENLSERLNDTILNVGFSVASVVAAGGRTYRHKRYLRPDRNLTAPGFN
jgi:hypothetical protein